MPVATFMQCRLLFAFVFVKSVAGSDVVHVGKHWKDTQGKRIEAHGGGMLLSPVDARWYWFGETRKVWPPEGINCYSSSSIDGPWSFEGRVFHASQIKQPDTSGPFVIERPKVLYNSRTRKFVMWFHLDANDYTYRHVGVATADAPSGPWEFVHGFQPDGIPSLDMSLFQDPVDGQAYFVRSCDNSYVGISRLTPDYLRSSGLISTYRPALEGMAIFRHPNGTYYMLTSHLTGWEPNPLVLLRASGSTLDAPDWVDMGNPTQHCTSFNSQPTFVVQYTPQHAEPYFVYMADNWLYCNPERSKGDLVDACYVWLPIQFLDDSVRIRWQSDWSLEEPFNYLATSRSDDDSWEQVCKWSTLSWTLGSLSICSLIAVVTVCLRLRYRRSKQDFHSVAEVSPVLFGSDDVHSPYVSDYRGYGQSSGDHGLTSIELASFNGREVSQAKLECNVY
eukprot:TRINITY_DN41912_c0_g1_i1.p1 TRINITY_DN41912_c0_g1~~TRINITY_DN41912_c0_g1_i1.p1  ORF type:complete len:448 (+),score=20.84 TRINITY_DN41912_c0_g1_i1:33-1376(+)